MTVEVDDFNKPPTVSCYANIWIFNVIFMLLTFETFDCKYEITITLQIRYRYVISATKFATITSSNKHRKYFTINSGTPQGDPMIHLKN